MTRQRRADARRNISAILDAALECLARDPEASIGEIAGCAGVGRVTLYGHFGSRAELVAAVFDRTVEETRDVLDAVDLVGDPRAALGRLVASTWQIVDRFRGLLQAAQLSLPPERVRNAHEGPMHRLSVLIERGRDEGVFRTDLPAPWMVALFEKVVHGAADEISAGRIAPDHAADLITATLQAAYTPPGMGVPER